MANKIDAHLMVNIMNDHYFENVENRKVENFTPWAKGEVELKYFRK